MRLAFLVCLFLGSMPYWNLFRMIILKLVFWQRLHIIEVGYSIADTHGSDENEFPFVMEGGKVRLYWKVRGALKQSLTPRFGRVKGSAADVIIDRDNRIFHLEFRGLFSKRFVRIEIPLSKIKEAELYSISSMKIQSKLSPENFPEIGFNTRLMSSFRNCHPYKSFIKKSIHTAQMSAVKGESKIRRTADVFAGKKLVDYSFSTSKYNRK
jgi:hypothetical protein